MSRSFWPIGAVLLAAAAIAASVNPCSAQWGEPTAAERKILKALDSPTELEYIETPLSDVVDFLRDYHHIEIQIDARSMADAGLDPEEPITRDLKKISLRSALRLLLDPLGMEYVLDDDVLLLTTFEDVEDRMMPRVYPIDDLIGRAGVGNSRRDDCRALIDLLTSTARPTSWDIVGGYGSIGTIPPGDPKSLVVFQTTYGHEEVANVLQLLRDVANAPAADAFPATGFELTRYRTDREQRIEKALAEPADLEFIETPLSDIVEFLQYYHKIEVQIDEEALDDIGLESDLPVTVNLKRIPLRSALRLMLREQDLSYEIRHEVLLITTPEESETHLSTVVYPFQHFLREHRDNDSDVESYPDTLIDLIRSMIAPTTWDTVGGAGRVTWLSLGQIEVLVVRQTLDVHEEVTSLLRRPEFRPATPPPRAESPASTPRRRTFPLRQLLRRR